MLSFLVGIVGVSISLAVMIWTYFHLPAYDFYTNTAFVCAVFVLLGVSMSYVSWIRQRATAFAIGVFVGGFLFLFPFAANTFGYAFIALPAVFTVATLSYVSVRFGNKLKVRTLV